MEEERNEELQDLDPQNANIRSVIREVIQEFVSTERSKAEPAYRVELAEERKRREQLERRVNELVQENETSRRKAEETERHAAIREELQGLGVTKVDLGFKAVKDDIRRSEDGRLVARTEGGEMNLRDYLAQFTKENPELLPARIAGGSGASGAQRTGGSGAGGVDLDRIKPGMAPEELERVRREIAQALGHTLRSG